MFINFNLENWPIVYFKSTDETINDESFNEYKKYYLNLLIKCKRNNEKIVIICDLLNKNISDSIPIKYILKQAQFNKEIYKFNKEYVKCICIICKNSNFKNILNVYFSLSKPAMPFKLCRTYEKSNIYLKEKFDIIFDTNIYNKENKIENDIEFEEESENIEETNYIKYIVYFI